MKTTQAARVAKWKRVLPNPWNPIAMRRAKRVAKAASKRRSRK